MCKIEGRFQYLSHALVLGLLGFLHIYLLLNF